MASNWQELSTVQIDAIFQEKGDLIASLQAKVDSLTATLQPFADYADTVGPDDPSPAIQLNGETPVVPDSSDRSGVDSLRVKHLRQAKAALVA